MKRESRFSDGLEKDDNWGIKYFPESGLERTMKMHLSVPHFEPEVIAAAARKRNGDDEKITTTSIQEIISRGVHISSRYDKAHELETMASMVEHITPDRLLGFIESLWCDSKANACYTVKLRDCPDELMHEIGRQFEAVCLQKDGGHNGITLEGPKDERLDIDPNWNEEDA